MNKTVTCPVCNKQLKQITKTHYIKHGYLSREEMLADYPNTKFVSEDFENRLKNILAERNKSEFMRKCASDRAKIRNANHDFQSYRHSKRLYTQEERNKISTSLKKAYKDGRRKLPTITWGKKIKYKINSGKEIYLRSFLECRVYRFLELNNFDFSYEELKIPYLNTSSNETKTYIPDFYLPKYNLIIEVKPKQLQIEQMAQDKKQSTITHGYNYLFVDDKELENYKDLLNKIYALDAK